MSKVIVLIFLMKSVDLQLINIQAIEQTIEANTKALISDEFSVLRVMNSLNSSTVFSRLNLNSINLAANLTAAMERLIPTIQSFQTTKNFEPFLNFTNPTECDFFFYRMAILDGDSKNFQITLASIKRNATKLYQDSRELYWNFGIYFKLLELNWTRQISVFNVFRNLWNVFQKYSGFSRLITTNLEYSYLVYNYLNQILQTANCPLINSTTKTKGDLIESDLVEAQSKLVDLEKIALQITKDALKIVTSTTAGPSDSPTRLNLISLKNAYEEVSTADDYPNLMWPRVPDTTDKRDNGFYVKVRSTKSKIQQYNFINDNIKVNKSRIGNIFNALSKTVTSSKGSRKVRSTSPAVNDVLNATSAVLNNFDTYSSRVSNAIILAYQIITANTAGCLFLKNISDSRGNYIKSGCLIQMQRTFSTGQPNCQSRNMPSLFAITNEDDYAGLKAFHNEFSMSYFSTTIDKRYQINGFQTSDGRWFNSNPLVTPLLNSAIPPYCLFIEGSTGVAKFVAFPCSKLSWMFCEYNKNIQTPTNCFNATDITATDGTYIKTICTLQDNVDQIKNNQNCKNIGASCAFTITRAEEITAVKNYFSLVSIGPITGSWFAIGGIFSSSYKWYYPDGQTFYLGNADGFDIGCLNIEGSASGTFAKSISCNVGNWFICEFNYY